MQLGCSLRKCRLSHAPWGGDPRAKKCGLVLGKHAARPSKSSTYKFVHTKIPDFVSSPYSTTISTQIIAFHSFDTDTIIRNMASADDSGRLKLQQLCTRESWWRVPHLIRLNLLLMVPFFTSYVGGYDGSMLNGIQTLPQWQEGTNSPP